MKKFLSILLVAVLLVTAMPLGAFEFKASANDEDYYTYTISNNGAVIRRVDQSISGNVTIPSTLGGYDVTTIYQNAFANCTAITGITIPNTITAIAANAFKGCEGIERVNINDLSAWCKINFANSYSNPTYYAQKLYLNGNLVTDLVVPNDVTSIGNGVFYNCESIVSVKIPNSVKSIGADVFFGTGYYNNRNNWKDNILYIGRHLIKADESVCDFKAIKKGTLTIAGSAFYGCSNLTDIIIPYGVISIGVGAFASCTSLVHVTIGDSVASVGARAFRECPNLEAVFYAGSEDEKTEIVVDFYYGIGLEGATWYYNCCVNGANHIDHDDLVCDECGNKNFVIGDIDSTGRVDLNDVNVTSWHLAGWDENVIHRTVNKGALDVNYDYEVNLKDLVLLAQYVAGWDVQIF